MAAGPTPLQGRLKAGGSGARRSRVRSRGFATQPLRLGGPILLTLSLATEKSINLRTHPRYGHLMQLDAPASRAELAAALATLGRSGWFAGRSERMRALIGAEARLRRFRPGETLYHVGDASNGLFGLVEGALRLSVPRDDGEDYVIHRADPGFWIGDAAQFSDDGRLVTLTAAASTTVVHVSAEALERLVEAEPRLYRDFYALTHQNFRTALRLFVNTLVPDSDLRVALRLLHQHELAGEPERGIALAQAEFADLVGLSLPTLQRALKRLAEAGLVEIGYGRIRILDREALLRRCLR